MEERLNLAATETVNISNLPRDSYTIVVLTPTGIYYKKTIAQ